MDGWSPKLTCTWYRSGVRNPRPQQLPPNRPFKNHHFGWPFLQFSRMSGCETCPLNLTRLKNPRLKNPHSQTPKKNSQKQTSLLYQNQIHYTQKKINGWNLKIPLEKGETTSNTSMFVVLGVYFPRCISIASIYLENPAFFQNHNTIPLCKKHHRFSETSPHLRNLGKKPSSVRSIFERSKEALKRARPNKSNSRLRMIPWIKDSLLPRSKVWLTWTSRV